MKTILGGILIGLVLSGVPVYAQEVTCDYVLSFDVSLKGTEIDDGYDVWGFTDYGYFFDVCGLFNGATSDVIYGELSDDVGVIWDIYGTILWNPAGTNSYIQGSDLNEDFSSFLDGKIKWSRGLYSISATGGANDGLSFIARYKSIRGYGYLDSSVLLSASGPDQIGRSKFQKLDKTKLLGLKDKANRNLSGINGGGRP